MNSTNPFSRHQLIINTLLLNASYIGNLGLMHGKMGIAIYFFHLAHNTNNQIYEDFAGELIDEIYEEINSNTPLDFENGLAGIGWGIEYLVQNGFIEANTDEVLEEFDRKINKELIDDFPKELSLLDGILGIGVYFLKRIQPTGFDANYNPASSYMEKSILHKKQLIKRVIDELDHRTKVMPKIFFEPLCPSNIHSKNPSKRQTPNNITFDITWDYPVLIWFLSDLYQSNIFNNTVEKIIHRIIKPLSDSCIYHELQSNSLLLALALTRLQQIINSKEQPINQADQSLDSLNIDNIITALLKGIDRKIINSELPKNNPTLRYGTAGIVWIYRQLYCLTENNHFKEEMEYWENFNLTVTSDVVLSENYVENVTLFGILEGVVGGLITTEIEKTLERETM